MTINTGLLLMGIGFCLGGIFVALVWWLTERDRRTILNGEPNGPY